MCLAFHEPALLQFGVIGTMERSGSDVFIALQVGDPTKAANESALSPIMNFTQVAPFGNASDYPFYYGCTADLGQTVYSNATVYGLMVCHSP